MAKAPQPGTVKTRLTPPLTSVEAAALYTAFVRDVALMAAGIPDSNACLFAPPGDDLTHLAALLPPGVTARSQTVTGLGDAMQAAVRELLAEGATVVAVVGADLPTLPAANIEQAFAMLQRGEADVVLGPSDDGGYYLLALRADQPNLFSDITWGTPEVLQQTLARADATGLRVRQLPGWHDVDDQTGLARLVAELSRDPALPAPATRVALQRLRHQGAALPPASLPWHTIESAVVHATPWRTLHADRLRLPDGAEIEYSYFTSADAVWVVPVTPSGEIVLIRQYRHPLRDWTLELPAGGADGKPLAEVAAAELREEVGGVARELRFIGTFFGAVAHAALCRNVFLALDVVLGEPEREPTELMTPLLVPAALAFDMARHGEINDGESALALLLCEQAILAELAAR